MGIVLELTDCLSHPLAQSFFTHRIGSINGGPFRIFSSIKSVTPCDLTDSPIKKKHVQTRAAYTTKILLSFLKRRLFIALSKYQL